MPIRPENRAAYPPRAVWQAMRMRVFERSGGQCECAGQCGLEHAGGRCGARHGHAHPSTGSAVVLTMAHFHGTALESTDIAVVFHGCQQCHNRYDAPMRRAGIKARKEAAAAAERERVQQKAGQLYFERICLA